MPDLNDALDALALTEDEGTNVDQDSGDVEEDDDSDPSQLTQEDSEVNDEEFRLPKQGPEREPLGLPSELSAEVFDRAQCSALGHAELQIRIGVAYDLIAMLKEAIARKSATVQSKRKHCRGQKDNIAANNQITTVHLEVHRLVAQYNDNFTRMNTLSTRLASLSVTASIPKTLKLINTTTDLGSSNTTPMVPPNPGGNAGGFNLQDARTLGDHNVVGSWIFHIAPPNDGSKEKQDAWERESMLRTLHFAYHFLKDRFLAAQRVQWFRSRANLARTNEEVNLILAEARALRRGFAFAGEEWARKLDARPIYASCGATAYAHQKSDMFSHMSEECDILIKSTWEKYHLSMAVDSARKEIYNATQKALSLSDDCIDYSIVSPLPYQSVFVYHSMITVHPTIHQPRARDQCS